MGGSAKYKNAHNKYKRKGFGHGNSGGGGGKSHFPVEANVRIKNKTTEGALSEFRNQHINSDHEWAYIIDDQGYVHEYNEGNKGSVPIYNTRGGHIIHNHPETGESAFSYEDMEVFAAGKAKSMTASSSKFDYTIERGTHFKEQEFVQALSKANLVGSDYNDAVDKWLMKNARRYGYKYTRTAYKADGSVGIVRKSMTKHKERK